MFVALALYLSISHKYNQERRKDGLLKDALAAEDKREEAITLALMFPLTVAHDMARCIDRCITQDSCPFHGPLRFTCAAQRETSVRASCVVFSNCPLLQHSCLRCSYRHQRANIHIHIYIYIYDQIFGMPMFKSWAGLQHKGHWCGHRLQKLADPVSWYLIYYVFVACPACCKLFQGQA